MKKKKYKVKCLVRCEPSLNDYQGKSAGVMDSMFDNFAKTCLVASTIFFVFVAIFFVVVIHLCAFGVIPTTLGSTGFIFVSAFLDFILVFTLVKTFFDI